MSEGTPASPSPQPDPNVPSPPVESFDAKVRRWIQELIAQFNAPSDTPEAQMKKMVYLLVAVGLGLFLLCGFAYLFLSLFL
jgi:hypothetical protein